MNCNKCGAEINDNVLFCTECGAKIEQDVNHENVFEYSNVNTNVTQQKHTGIIILGITVGVFIVIAVIMAAIIIPKASVRNQRALELYDRAYENFYAIDNTYTSPETAHLIGDARQAANSILVLSDTKKDIEKLYRVAGDYTALGKAETHIFTETSAQADLNKAKTILEQISEDEVIHSDRYTETAEFIKKLEFKKSSKTWADTALDKLKKEHPDIIEQWRKTAPVVYYTGSVTLIEATEEYVELILDDYDGITHNLIMYYNYDEGSSWDKNLGELREHLQNSNSCVMAAMVSKMLLAEQVFSYNYIYE